MARRQNELFIGSDYLNVEGRSIKHPALIKLYATINPGKINKDPLALLGLDLETNHITGELRLLGFWNGQFYDYQTDNFLGFFISKLRSCRGTTDNPQRSIAFWNQLDPFIIFKEFLKYTEPKTHIDSLGRYGKIGGEYDEKEKRWTVPPVVEVEWHDVYVGIQMVLNGSVQFFIRKLDGSRIFYTWGYDISALYESHLEAEATPRLPYYKKGGDELHKIDWERFDRDTTFREAVLESNMLDARAVYDLGIIIQEEFKTAFHHYPVSLVSQGSLARSAIVATLTERYKAKLNITKPGDPDFIAEPVKEAVMDDLKSIGFINYYDGWFDQIGGDALKDLYALSMEAYSGGYIESLRYGKCADAWYCDIASAYPAVIRQLFDLRGCKITHGKGEPPHIPNSYCFVRGTCHIPATVNYHPITVKHPMSPETNIRAVGTYKASYTIEERDFLITQGGTFTDDVWYNIETKGVLSPMAEVCDHFLELRAKLKKDGNSAQYMAKIAANSMYGILFEAVDTFETKAVEVTDKYKNYHPYKDLMASYLKSVNFSGMEADLQAIYGADYKKIVNRWKVRKNDYGLAPDVIAHELEERGCIIEETHPADILKRMNEMYAETINGEMHRTEERIQRGGYRAGEFFNPIYATIITSRARLLISKALASIASNGGKPILVMTDSIFWEGRFDDLPTEYWREKKTVGYFEKPALVHNMVCLGAGRYEYESDDDHVITAKRRGLNAVDMHDEKGTALDAFNWTSCLDLMARTHSEKISIKVRALLSVGIVLHNNDYTVDDLGRIVDDFREVEVIVGRSKRVFPNEYKDPAMLLHGMLDTFPIVLGVGMFGEGTMHDQTLPHLREKMAEKEVITANEKTKRRKSINQQNYAKKPKTKEKLSNDYKTKYSQIRDAGYSVIEAKNMAKWSMERIMNQMMEDGKI